MSSSIDKAFVLLGLVAEGISTLSELADKSGMPKSTTHRLLKKLVFWRILSVEKRTYRLGVRLIELGEFAKRGLHLAHVARDSMAELSRRTRETVHLGILDGDDIIYLEKVNGDRGLQMASYVGLRAPAQCTAIGKAIIAAQPEATWHSHFRELAPRTEYTIRTAEAFVAELKQVRLNGYALDQEENEVGIRCIAAPIRDASGKVFAALSLSGASVYVTQERQQALVPEVTGCAASISRLLGTYTPAQTDPLSNVGL